MTTAEFNSQLDTMEKGLMNLYRNKIKLVSIRESLRFQYVSAMRAKWDAVLGAMYSAGYMEGNSFGVQLLTAILPYITIGIPMVDMNGNPSSGWGTNPNNPGTGGNVSGAGFLSPIQNIISKPFYSLENSTDQRTALKIYGIGYWNEPVENILGVYFFGARFTTLQDIPPSADWVQNALVNNQALTRFETSYPFIVDVMTKDFPQGSFKGVIAEMRDLLSQIIAKTQYILTVQEQIDAAEKSLSDFVGDYQAIGGAVDVAALLLQLQAEAERADVPPPVEQAQAEVLPIAIPQEEKSMKLPWILGALVAGVWIMGKKKA